LTGLEYAAREPAPRPLGPVRFIKGAGYPAS
jgi:hypothetical protein